MNLKKETEKKIANLQLIEQNIQNTMMQKQLLQNETSEIDNALEEIEKSSSNPYKIIGSIMVAAEKESLIKELNNKKEILDLKIESFRKQEEDLRKKFKRLQEEIIGEIKE